MRVKLKSTVECHKSVKLAMKGAECVRQKFMLQNQSSGIHDILAIMKNLPFVLNRKLTL